MVETSQDFRVLWLTVIKRAQDEADGMYGYWDEEGEKIQIRAKKWLTRRSRSLCEVCGMAGFNPEMTKRFIEDMKRRYEKKKN